MKITRRDLKVILLLIGILSAFLVYQFNFKGKLEDIDAEEVKQSRLQDEIKELEEKEKKKPAMTKTMQEYKAAIDEKIELFPSFTKYEDMLLYLYNLEHKYAIYFSQYTLAESNEAAKVTGKIDNADYNASMMMASTRAKYSATYDDLKKVLTNIYNSENRVRVLSAVKMELNKGSRDIFGEITFFDYAIAMKDRVYTDIKVPEFEEVYESDFVPSTDPDTGKYNGIIGVDNIFGEEETTEASTEEETMGRR